MKRARALAQAITSPRRAVVLIAAVALAAVLYPTIASSIEKQYISICKDSATDGPVSGTFTFTVESLGSSDPSPRTYTVAVGSCTADINVAPGKVRIVEQPKTGAKVTAIDGPNPDLANRSTVVDVPPNHQKIHFTNQSTVPGLLKVCKVAGPGVGVGTVFTFTANSGAPVSVPAGPEPWGNCRPLGYFPPGTPVTVNEAPRAGVIVSAINVIPASRIVGSPNLGGRTVKVNIGTGKTDVRFTNRVPVPWSAPEVCFPAPPHPKPKFADTVTVAVDTKSGHHGTYVVPVGACTPDIGVRAGDVTFSVVGGARVKLVGCHTFPKGMQKRCNRRTRTSTVKTLRGNASRGTVAFLDVRPVHRK